MIHTSAIRQTSLNARDFSVLGWGHTSAQNASVVTHFVTSVLEIERNQWIPTYEARVHSCTPMLGSIGFTKCITTDAFCALV
jgi:hypothetical protein